jgi:hypothetical protein
MEWWQVSLPTPLVMVVAMTHSLAVRKHEKKILLIGSVSLHATLSLRRLTNLAVNNTLLYLPWSDFPNNKTRNIGTIAFVLISTGDDDLLSPDSVGLGESVNETLVLTVWSWIANDTLSELQMISTRIRSTDAAAQTTVKRPEIPFERMYL